MKNINSMRTRAAAVVLLFVLLCPVSALFAQDTSASDALTRKNSAVIKPEIPLGIWRYGVYAGKNRLGSAVVTVSFENGIYTSVSSVTIEKNNKEVIFVMTDTQKESAGFEPLSFSSSSTALSGKEKSTAAVSGTFSGLIVTIKDSSGERSIALPEKFLVTSNYFTRELKKKGYKPGSVIKRKFYDPSMDEESLIEGSETVIGREIVDMPSGRTELLHSVQSFGPLKNIHNYMDDRGTVCKVTMSMLNQTVNMVLDSYTAKPAK